MHIEILYMPHSVIQNPSQNSLIDKVKELVSKRAAVAVDKLENHKHLRDDYGLSSIDVLTIVALIEDTLDLQLPESEWEQLATLGQMENYIATKMNFIAAASLGVNSSGENS
jgi:acyl carrier protein